MANYGHMTRVNKLREGWQRGQELLKASGGKVFQGFADIIQRNVYNPNWLHAADWAKVAEMTEDEFVSYALGVKAGIKADEVLPGFENEPKPDPVQTAIDFDKERIADNLCELIIIGRQIVEALNRVANVINMP